MKVGASIGMLLLGIALLGCSYIWKNVIPLPFSDDEYQKIQEENVRIHEAPSSGELVSSEDTAAAKKLMDEYVLKTRAYDQKVSLGRLAFRMSGVLSVLLGVGLYVWARTQEE